jgi:hypothetical protein
MAVASAVADDEKDLKRWPLNFTSNRRPAVYNTPGITEVFHSFRGEPVHLETDCDAKSDDES